MKSSELVSAPRGLLKILILDMASKNPISGIEISEKIDSLSRGKWKPSPGSIYYILKELVIKKRLSEIYTPNHATKKYIITEKGISDITLFKSFGTEILKKQIVFISLTSKLLQFDSIDIIDDLLNKINKINELK
jgi:DNA-binding PadR family transcriptional regulator